MNEGAQTIGTRPRFSVVTAVYNVSNYLPAFISSLEAQRFDLGRLEIIAVDDGSTDDSLVLLKDWAARRPNLVTVLTKENGGQGSARNLGIEHATGEWVTMPDPDDILEPDYFAAVDNFLQSNETAVMVATNRIYLQDATGKLTDTHPLRAHFEGGDRLIDIDSFPDFFHGSAPAAFFRSDILDSSGVLFDDRVQPNFEDGHFCCRYLLGCPSSLVGFVQSARYIYRRRSDGSSTLQNSLRDPRRFLSVPRFGYLDALKRGAEAKSGKPPAWLQNFVLYEISFYFSSDLAFSRPSAAHGKVGAEFVEILREIVQLLDPDVIRSFRVRTIDRVWRDILLHALREDNWCTDYAVVQRYDPSRKAIRVAYRYSGRQPEETILVDGKPFDVTDGKIRDHQYFGEALLYERAIWIPLKGSLQIRVDGNALEIQPAWEPIANTMADADEIKTWFQPPTAKLKRRANRSFTDRLLLLIGWSWPVRRVFRDAWVLMDRIDLADDNGERLFRYLRDNRPDINAWFTMKAGTADWNRLRADGYQDRVVAHGSLRWKLLMLNCANLVSSHADAPIVRPRAIARLAKPRWRFVFLQHGVIKDDLSRWLNRKSFSLFVTSTPQEHKSIVGDHTPYVYTTREVKMTGLPRFDRLREIDLNATTAKRDLILICPTWREWLKVPNASDEYNRSVISDFLDSDYIQNWRALLADETLKNVAERNNLQVAFLPHPNVQSALPEINVPEHVTTIRYDGTDIQSLIVRAAVMVTDYSSMAFNAAYIDRPVVYFQFDGELLEEGAHMGRPGYFEYGRDGFGPVARTSKEAASAVTAMLEGGENVTAEYRKRVAATFPDRDGRCCERTVAAIEDLGPALRPEGLIRRAVRSQAVRRLARQRGVQRVLRAKGGRVVAQRVKQYAKPSL